MSALLLFRGFSLLTPLLWVAAMFLLLLAVRVLQNRSPGKWRDRETIEWGRPGPSSIQRWMIKMRKIRFRLPRFSQRQMPEIAPKPAPSVPANAPADPLKKPTQPMLALFVSTVERSFSKPLLVIKHNVSPEYQQRPPDEHGKAVQAQVEEELSSLYLKGSPGFRVDILDAQHMSFSDMAFLSTWADSGRRYGTHNPADGAETAMVIRDYILAFFDKFLRGKDSPLLHPDHPGSVISTLRSTDESK
jgi:hypothetical protein